MSSKRAVRRKSCEGKIRHAGRGEAWAHVKALSRTKRNQIVQCRPYACSFCHGWHIGHQAGSLARALLGKLA